MRAMRKNNTPVNFTIIPTPVRKYKLNILTTCFSCQSLCVLVNLNLFIVCNVDDICIL